MKENQACHVCWMYIYTAYSIGSKASAYRKSIVAVRDIWKQMNVAKKTISVVSKTKNYQCSQAVIGQLCIVSYRWLANSTMSTIIREKFTKSTKWHTAGVFNPRPAGHPRPSGDFCVAQEGYFTKYNALWILKLESLDSIWLKENKFTARSKILNYPKPVAASKVCYLL